MATVAAGVGKPAKTQQQRFARDQLPVVTHALSPSRCTGDRWRIFGGGRKDKRHQVCVAACKTIQDSLNVLELLKFCTLPRPLGQSALVGKPEMTTGTYLQNLSVFSGASPFPVVDITISTALHSFSSGFSCGISQGGVCVY